MQQVNNIIEINGVKYAPIKKLTTAAPEELNKILIAGSAIYAPYIISEFNPNSYYTRELPKNLDIVKEYELIQLKASKLSKWERDTVTHIFLKNFYKI